jgi:hypothetical protein
VAHKADTLKCCAVTEDGNKTGLHQAGLYLNYFRNTLNSLPVVDMRLIGRKCLREYGVLTGFGMSYILLPSSALKMGQPKAVIK